ncbi:MAG: hypothetical protein ACMUIA_00040 [bacterium]
MMDQDLVHQDEGGKQELVVALSIMDKNHIISRSKRGVKVREERKIRRPRGRRAQLPALASLLSRV